VDLTAVVLAAADLATPRLVTVAPWAVTRALVAPTPAVAVNPVEDLSESAAAPDGAVAFFFFLAFARRQPYGREKRRSGSLLSDGNLTC